MKNLKKIVSTTIVFCITYLSIAQVYVPGGYTSIGNSGAGNLNFIHNNPNGGLWLVRNNLSTFRSQISFKQGTATSNTEKLALGIDWNSNNTNDFFISQAGTPTADPRFYISSGGKIGINTSNITSSSPLLTVSGGDIRIIETLSSPYSVDAGADLYLQDQQGGILDVASYQNIGRIDASNTNNNLIRFNMWGGTVQIGQPIINPYPSSGIYSFSMAGNAALNGKVVIGLPTSFTAATPFPAGYNLYVSDGILTEKVKIALKNTTDWSDFVFAADYKLMPLDSVAAYVKENKHLPDVPSAQEVVDNGIDVGKMDAVLLQKIEELTLYMIQLKEENEKLNQEINNLKKALK